MCSLFSSITSFCFPLHSWLKKIYEDATHGAIAMQYCALDKKLWRACKFIQNGFHTNEFLDRVTLKLFITKHCEQLIEWDYFWMRIFCFSLNLIHVRLRVKRNYSTCIALGTYHGIPTFWWDTISSLCLLEFWWHKAVLAKFLLSSSRNVSTEYRMQRLMCIAFRK